MKTKQQNLRELISDVEKKGLKIYRIDIISFHKNIVGYIHDNEYDYVSVDKSKVEEEKKFSFTTYEVGRNDKNEIVLAELEKFLTDKDYELGINYFKVSECLGQELGSRIEKAVSLNVIIHY